MPGGADKQQAVFSYFKGPEKDWKTGLPTYSKIVYRDLWPGIDLVYNGTVNKLKYEFVVAPGADPRADPAAVSRGRPRVTHDRRRRAPRRDARGLVRGRAAGGVAGDRRQARAGRRWPTRSGEGGAFGFDVGDYDRTRPLVLDPAVIVYCGYIGGTRSTMALAPLRWTPPATPT